MARTIPRVGQLAQPFRPRTPVAPAPGIVYPAWARSSVAERGTFNPCVVGSNPTGLTAIHARTANVAPLIEVLGSRYLCEG
jgi:hypothetical protein